jgi:hypothetical protein
MEFMKRFPSVKEKVPFENFGFKGGILFKISGEFFNGSHLSKAQPEYLPECAIE